MEKQFLSGLATSAPAESVLERKAPHHLCSEPHVRKKIQAVLCSNDWTQKTFVR